jgi:SAM-dependent methyltransferase
LTSPVIGAIPAVMRRHSAACERNRDPILAVLRRVFPARGEVLEIAAGSGQHAAYFSDALRDLTWWPTDPTPEALASIDDWARDAHGDLRPAQRLDVFDDPWPVAACDAMLCANMIHIAPWEATGALLRGASRTLRPGGVMVLYGPYTRDGVHTAPSNEAFDGWLKSQDPRWGVRDLGVVTDLAAAQGIRLHEVLEMPANNLCVVLRRVSVEAS